MINLHLGFFTKTTIQETLNTSQCQIWYEFFPLSLLYQFLLRASQKVIAEYCIIFQKSLEFPTGNIITNIFSSIWCLFSSWWKKKSVVFKPVSKWAALGWLREKKSQHLNHREMFSSENRLEWAAAVGKSSQEAGGLGLYPKRLCTQTLWPFCASVTSPQYAIIWVINWKKQHEHNMTYHVKRPQHGAQCMSKAKNKV